MVNVPGWLNRYVNVPPAVDGAPGYGPDCRPARLTGAHSAGLLASWWAPVRSPLRNVTVVPVATRSVGGVI